MSIIKAVCKASSALYMQTIFMTEWYGKGALKKRNEAIMNKVCFLQITLSQNIFLDCFFIFKIMI